MLTNLFFIAVICVIIIDISGFIEGIESLLTKVLGYKVRIPKPFSCSMCSTHWIGLIYLIFTHFSIESYMILLLISICTPLIENVIRNLMDIVGILINVPMTFFHFDN